MTCRENPIGSKPDTTTQNASNLKLEQANRAHRRLNDMLEDDEVGEALKSLHELADLRPKAE